MRVLVCGGRDFNNYEVVKQWVDSFSPTHIIEGGAKGADTLGWKYAKSNGIDFTTFKAEWDRHGKAAGMIRNQQMIDEGKPDLVVAFQGGRGTQDMIKRAKKHGIEVVEVKDG